MLIIKLLNATIEGIKAYVGKLYLIMIYVEFGCSAIIDICIDR